MRTQTWRGNAGTHFDMMFARLSRSILQRLIFLLAGNLLLLAAIGFLLKEGGSFSDVLVRAGPDVAPVILAGIGLTGIIFAGALDLSIASVIAMAGTVFGILTYRGANALACYVACFTTAWALSMLNGFLVRSLRI